MELGKIFDFALDLKDKGYPQLSTFKGLIDDAKDSVDCYKKLIDIFALALKLNSIRYRTKNLAPEDFIRNKIANAITLGIVLDNLPTELKDPMVQVMFEKYNIKDYSKNEYSYYIDTNNENEDLKKAVNSIKFSRYANLYNEMLVIYGNENWGDKNTLPIKFDNPILRDNPDLEELKKRITLLSNWILANNPKLIFLEKLNVEIKIQIKRKEDKKVDVSNLIKLIYEDHCEIDTYSFTEVLLEKIRASTSTVGSNSIGVKFIRAFQVNLKKEEIWKDPNLNDLTKQILEIAKVSEANKAWLIHKISLILKIGLSLTQITDEVKETFRGFLSTFLDSIYKHAKKKIFLKNLNTTYLALKSTIRQDAITLTKSLEKINEDNPKYINEEYLILLASAANNIFENIPLKYKKESDDSNKYLLFSFNNYSSLEGSTTDFFDDDVKIDVPLDLDEEQEPFTRPIFRSFKASYAKIENVPILKFFNVSPKEEKFYYRPTGSQGSVATKIKEDKLILINMNKKKIFQIKDIGELINIKFNNFYKYIRKETKWKNYNGRRRYYPIYSITPNNRSSHLIWRPAAGKGIGRSEKIEDDLVLWELGKNGSNYPRLGEFLNLPQERQITYSGNIPGTTLKINRSNYNYIKSDLNINGIIYKILKISNQKSSHSYVQVNTPRIGLQNNINEFSKILHSKKLSNDQEEILSIFDFCYYRKIDPNIFKVLKHIEKGKATKRPVVIDGVFISEEDAKRTTIGINLPISFSLKENIKFAKGDWPAIKNKEKNLFTSQGKRQDAGKTMMELYGLLKNKPQTEKTFPATKFGDWLISESENKRTQWNNTKNTDRSLLTVNQEWCHIRGHGDGGTERLGNFVSGSYHCNTEQLAIESGQRITTQSELKEAYKLYSSAYLFKGKDQELFDQNYLDNEEDYKKMKKIHNEIKINQNRPPNPNNEGAGTVLPLANFFRYKIIHKPDSGNSTKREKYFDYIFEGQSEFMDVHQYNILNRTVQFMLEGEDAFIEWYNSMKETKMEIE